MVAGEDQDRATRTSVTPRATFELERFAWGAPDRLQVAGTFSGLVDAPPAAPELVVRGVEGTHRLQAVADSLSGPPENGSLWSAEFAWQEPPVAFDSATIELGPEIVVELPEPGAKRRWNRGQTLEVRSAASAEGAPEKPGGTARDQHGGPEPEDAAPARGAERVRLEAELLAAQEEILELRAAVERAQEELGRARDDLRAERDRHAGDVERFREGLANLRESAAAALAVEQRAAQQVASELQEARVAIEAKDADVEELRGQLEQAAGAQTQAESEARTAAQTLREHLAGLNDARSAADKARADGERMLSRLETIRDALRDGR